MTECGWFAYDKSLEKCRTDTLRYARTMFRHSTEEPWRIKVRDIDLPMFSEIQLGEVPKYEPHSKSIYNRCTRFVISESEITAKIAKGDFMNFLLTGEDYSHEKISRVVDFDNSVEIKWEDVEHFLDIWMEDPNGFRPIRTERYYDRDKAEVLLGDTYPLRAVVGLNPDYTKFVARESKDRMEDHDAVVLWNWVRDSLDAGMALGEIPRRNISDDEIILSDVDYMSFTLLFVVTNDKKLALEIANRRLPKKTYRIPVLLWLESRCDYRLFGDPMTWNNVWVDMGSYESYMAQMNIHGVSALTTFSSLKEMIIPDILPDEIKVRPKDAPTRTDGPTAIPFPVRGFPERYEILLSDIHYGLRNRRPGTRLGRV